MNDTKQTLSALVENLKPLMFVKFSKKNEPRETIRVSLVAKHIVVILLAKIVSAASQVKTSGRG